MKPPVIVSIQASPVKIIIRAMSLIIMGEENNFPVIFYFPDDIDLRNIHGDVCAVSVHLQYGREQG